MLRIKYLGVIINDKLKWCELISYVKNKVSWCNNKSIYKYHMLQT